MVPGRKPPRKSGPPNVARLHSLKASQQARTFRHAFGLNQTAEVRFRWRELPSGEKALVPFWKERVAIPDGALDLYARSLGLVLSHETVSGKRAYVKPKKPEKD